MGGESKVRMTTREEPTSVRDRLWRAASTSSSDLSVGFSSSIGFPSSMGEFFAFAWTAYMDLKEISKAYVIKADLPLLKKEEVKDSWILQICGKRSHEKVSIDTWHRIERGSDKFLHKFCLPENAKVNYVRASMEDDVLTITIPKVEAKN